jgi:hypothetical protein
MPVSFSLEKRTNRYGECPIRLSWKYGKCRYQTTLGFSIKPANWDLIRHEVGVGTYNQDGVFADDINYYIRRIRTTVHRIEAYYKSHLDQISDLMMKEVIRDTRSKNIHNEQDIVDRYTTNLGFSDNPGTRYYRSVMGDYYRLVCNAFDPYQRTEFYILQELFGETRRIIVPIRDFEKVKDHTKWAMAKYTEVTEDEAIGRVPRKK